MLDHLIESKSNSKENKSRGGFLLSTFALVAMLLSSAMLWSLFAKDLGIGRGEFELSALVAPIPMPENAPAVQKQERREQAAQTKNDVIVRQANIMRLDEEQPAPNEISVAPNTQKARPNGYFLIRDNGLENGAGNSLSNNSGRIGTDGVGLQTDKPGEVEKDETENIPAPPSLKKRAEENIEKRKTIMSTGVVNGQATSLPKPPYPPVAQAVHAGGAVNVQVTIDERGNVISAKAADGHPLLRAAAERAALAAKFKPTLLNNQPVKVTGMIIYKFSPQ